MKTKIVKVKRVHKSDPQPWIVKVPRKVGRNPRKYADTKSPKKTA